MKGARNDKTNTSMERPDLFDEDGISMKILLFNWRDVRNMDAGGAEVLTHQVLKRAVERGHDVTMFSAAFPNCLNSEVIDGVKIFRGGSRWSVYRAARRFYRKLDDDFDIIIDEINTIPFMTPSFVKRRERIVVLIHQLAREFWYYETPFPINSLGFHFFEKRWLKKYRDIPTITVSESTKKDLVGWGFNDVMIMPEGIDYLPLDSVPVKEDRPTAVFVGRFKRAKRPHHALHAYKIAKESIPDLQLWMIGDGYCRERLQKQYSSQDVHFYGRLPQSDKKRLVSKAHMIIVPAVREGWGLVVTEANALGTMALGYDVNGLRDSIKDKVTGLSCAPDPDSMASKMVELFSTPELIEKLSYNALEDSRNYSWENACDAFLDHLQSIIDRNDSRN